MYKVIFKPFFGKETVHEFDILCFAQAHVEGLLSLGKWIEYVRLEE